MNWTSEPHSRDAATASRGAVSTGIRLALFLSWSGLVIVLWLMRRLFLLRSGRALVAADYSNLWSRGTLRLLGIKVERYGEPPASPFFLVTNHLGYLDIAVLASQLKCTFVSKSEVSDWPLFGTLATLSETLYVDRESMRDTHRVNARIAAHFDAGGSLTLFPEGTSTDGYGLAPFRSSLLNYPAAFEKPVHCAAIRYTAPEGSPPASESMCWWGEMTLLPHLIRLFGTAGMRAEVNFSSVTVTCGDRKELAAKLQVEVGRCLHALQCSDVQVAPSRSQLLPTHP